MNSGTVTVIAGTPTSLTITTAPPASFPNDSVFTPAPVIQVNDASGNGVPGVNVTAAIFSGGGMLGGTTTVATDALGVATFTDLKITGTIGDRILSFTTPNGATVNSGTVTVTAGAFTKLIVVQQPDVNATAGVPFTSQPIVQMADTSGNAVSTAGVQIDATLESGLGVLTGTSLSTTTAADGKGTWLDLAISDGGSGASGPHTLRFTATVSGIFVISTTVTIP